MLRFFSEKNILFLDRVDSTNTYALNLLKKGKVADGIIVITAEQTSGKGAGENKWVSESHKNLTFSIIFYPEFLSASSQFLLNKAISLGICDYFKKIVKKNSVTIKWPNDIYVDDKKIAGILIETAINSSFLEYAVVGIGLNINQTNFVGDIPNPISLKLIEEKDFNLDHCFYELLECVENRYLQLKNNKTIELNSAYLNRLYLYRQKAKYKSTEEIFYATLIGISDVGRLILQKENGETKEYNFKEVEFCLNAK